MQISDQEVEAHINSLEDAIERWATARGLWFDAGFQSFAERIDGEPGETPVSTILYSDGELVRFITEDIDGVESEFSALLARYGFWYESADGCSLHIYPEEEGALHQAILDYVRWQWLCGLIQPDIDDV